jgi:hypothetical protein
LRLQPGDNPFIPSPEYAFDVEIPVGSERVDANFDRALYTTLFSKSRNTPSESQEDKPLSTLEKEKLKTRLRSIRVREKCALTLVIKGLSESEALNRIAAGYQAHMVLPSTEVVGALLRLEDAEILLAELGEFWEVLQIINQPDHVAKTEREKTSTPRDTPMSSSPTINQHFHAPVTGLAMSTGDHSPATVNQTQGADLSALVPLAHNLLAAIDALGPGKARDKLRPRAETLLAEAEKKHGADSATLKDALDAIKDGADYIDAGGTIAKLCEAAYTLLGSVLSLP